MVLRFWLDSVVRLSSFLMGPSSRTSLSARSSVVSWRSRQLARKKRPRRIKSVGSGAGALRVAAERLEHRALLSAVTSVVATGQEISAGTGDLNAGHQVTFAVNFDSAVTVNSSFGLPSLSLSDGGTAHYNGGSGTSSLSFVYIVIACQNSGDLAVSAFNLNGSSIQSGGSFSNLAGAVTNPAGVLQVDTTAPTVTVGTATQGAGNTLQYALTFSETVTGVDINAFGLSTTGMTGASILTVTQGVDAAHYNLLIDSGSGGGTINVNVNGANIRDLAGNALSSGVFVSSSQLGSITGDPLSVSIADINGDGNGDIVTAIANSVNSSGIVSVQLGRGDGSFATARSFAVGSTPRAVSIADLNHDGKLDIVTANGQDNTVSVLLGDGTGNFAAANNFNAGTFPLSLAIADLNQDGNLDVAVTNVTSSTVSVLLGDGTGGFASPSSFSVGQAPSSIAFGDLNGDHKVDLVTANGFDNTVSVLLGTGNGGFATGISLAVAAAPTSIAVADMNGDGKADIVTSNQSVTSAGTVSVFLGSGTGSFGTATNFTVGDGPQQIVVADLNGDGWLDLITANVEGGSITVLLGTGAGGFAVANNYEAGVFVRSVAVGDVNGDGTIDVVATDIGNSGESLLLGTGMGRFRAATNLLAPPSSSVAATDINGDGIPDIVLLNNVAGSVSVLLGQGLGDFGAIQNFVAGRYLGTVALADVNGDDKIDIIVTHTGTPYAPGNTVSVLLGDGTGLFRDPVDFTTGSGPSSVAIADVNGDGKLDIVTTNSGTTAAPGNTVSVLLGTGTGRFQAATNFTVGASPGAVAIADVNRDGKLDIIAANTGLNVAGGGFTVSVLLGTGAGQFSAASTFAVGGDPRSVLVGDLNGDGNPDIVTANSRTGDITALLGTGTGSFGTRIISSTRAEAFYGAALADVNGDGKLDVVATNGARGKVSVLLGLGTGEFGAQTTYDDGAAPMSLAVADVYGDSRTDIITVDAGGRGVNLFLNGLAPQLLRTTSIAGVASVTASGSGIFDGAGVLNAGKSVTFTVTFSSAVILDSTVGLPDLSLNDGGTATYLGGSGTTALTFTYAVGASDNSTDLTVTALNLNGATLQAGGLTAHLSGATANPAGILQIDTVAPTVTSTLVGAANRTAVSQLQFAVTFSEPVHGIDANSFSLVTTGVVGASISDVSQGADTAHYIVTLTSGSGLGTIGLNVTGGTISDFAGNSLSTQTTSTFNIVANQAPIGASKTVATIEDQGYVLQSSDFGFADTNDNQLSAVKFTIVSAYGTLTNNGVAVVANQSVTANDVSQGKLVFHATANLNGGPLFLAKFQVEDDGGTANGGVDLDPNGQVLTFRATSVNDAPVGTSGTVTFLEDQNYMLKTSDFGFTDPNDSPANQLLSVKFDIVSAYGTLTDNGVVVTANQSVSATDISQGKLVFKATANMNGGPYFLAKFQVQDNGGTANGGFDLDPNGQVLTFRATSVNDAPAGTSGAVTIPERNAYVLKTSDFGFTDPHDNPANQLLAVKFDIISAYGTLSNNGVAVTANQSVSALDISHGKLVFTPAANIVGGPYFLAKFRVQDNGGTASGGIDLDPVGQVLTFTTTNVNDPPVGASGTVTIRPNQGYVLKVSDFGFTDPHDNPSNQLLAVKFDIVSAYGTLTDNGVTVTANQFVSASDISSGKLIFTPSPNIVGGPYFLAKFQVQDNGGTVNGGLDLDPLGQVLTFKVTSAT